MKTVEKIESKKAKLSGAYYTMKRAGQEIPSKSDDIKVKVKISIPANGSSILPELQFNYRLGIMGDSLTPSWGYTQSNTYRANSTELAGQKWGELFERGTIFAEAEIAKLETALEQRAQALINAED